MKIDVEWYYINESAVESTIELLGMDPVPALEYYSDNKSAQMRRCPAYLDVLKNTYVVCAPIDYEIEINKEEKWLNVKHPQRMPQELIDPRFDEEGDSPYPLFSLAFGQMVFQARTQDVWIEQVDPFMEWERKNKIRIVGGIFNIHRWVRSVQATFEQQEKNTTVRIKRGDPLFYVRFTSTDPRDIIALKKVVPSKEDIADYQRNVALKDVYPNASLAFLYKLRDKMLGRK